MSKSIAIIPARGGSKRIPRKNIKNFLGKPIISYPIQAAIKSNIFADVMVSTDDPEIAKLAKEIGADIPFLRSQECSDDFATTADVITEVLDSYHQKGVIFDFVCCIYPTAPFVTPATLVDSFRLLVDSKADSLTPIVRHKKPIQRSLEIKNGLLQYCWPHFKDQRSQDLSETYYDAGQFYWIKTESFNLEKTLMTENCAPYIVDEAWAQDIDTIDDWREAENKFQKIIDPNSIREGTILP